MSTIEDQLRAELKRLTDQAQPGQLRPLRVPGRRREGHRWLLPAGAIATVSALIAALLVIIPHARPQATSATAAMPRYYVTLSSPVSSRQARIVVHDSADGHPTGSTTIGALSGIFQWWLTAASDDRTFVISAETSTRHVRRMELYRLSVSASGGIALVTDVGSFPVATHAGVTALSSDASMLAIPLSGPSFIGVEVINLISRQVRTWSAPGAGYWPGNPSWGADGTTLMFPWLHFVSSAQTTVLAGIRRLNVSAAGTNLLSSRLTWFAQPIAVGDGFVMITADGRHIFGGQCRYPPSQDQNHGRVSAEVAEYSAANGQRINVLGSQIERYSSTKQGTMLFDECSGVMSVDRTGQHLLVEDLGFGRIDNGVYTALPRPASIAFFAW